MADSQNISVNSVLQSAAKNDVLRQLLILVGIAASVALGVAAVLWSQSGDYRALYSSLPPERASSVVDALNVAGIPYRIQDSTGAIMTKKFDSYAFCVHSFEYASVKWLHVHAIPEEFWETGFLNEVFFFQNPCN